MTRAPLARGQVLRIAESDRELLLVQCLPKKGNESFGAFVTLMMGLENAMQQMGGIYLETMAWHLALLEEEKVAIGKIFAEVGSPRKLMR